MGPFVSKPLSGRSLLQVVVGVAIAALGHVSKPLSGRSLLQGRRVQQQQQQQQKSPNR
jgi:hypothetical protein